MDLSFLGNSSSVGYFPSFHQENIYKSSHSFKGSSALGITIPTILDKTMAPPGCHSISAHELVEHTYTPNWNAKKSELSRKVLNKVETILPGIKNNLLHFESATPATLERYTNNFHGAAYGWRQVPGKRIMTNKIKNLFIVGHWAEMGGGIMASACSGLKAARSIKKQMFSK